jgi:hypothetical protein
MPTFFGFGTFIRWPNLRDQVRYAVIAYRDYDEAYKGIGTSNLTPPKRLEILEWTADKSAVQEFMEGLKAEGGGDIAEDLAGAMLRVS